MKTSHVHRLQEQDVPPRSAGYVSPEQILSYRLTDYEASFVPCNPFACDVFALAAIMANLMLGLEAEVIMPSSHGLQVPPTCVMRTRRV